MSFRYVLWTEVTDTGRGTVVPLIEKKMQTINQYPHMNKTECAILYHEPGSYLLPDFTSHVTRLRDPIYYSINYDDI